MHLTVPEAIARVARGEFVIVTDDAGRENEGDLTIAAQFATPEAVNFMATHGRGLICVAMTGDRLDALGLPLMVAPERNGSGFGTAFTVSVEARQGVSTGISAADRSRTISLLADPSARPGDFAQPGHVFPLRARPGGVLERPGQTEAGVDLARLAGLEPASAICEIMNPDGSMARMADLEGFAEAHGIGIVTVADLIAYRERIGDRFGLDRAAGIARGAQTRLPTPHGEFTVTAYPRPGSDQPDLALSMGEIADEQPVLARVHSECLTGDVFGSGRCDCGEQLQRALARIAAEGRGVLLYLRQEGRGIGLHNKLLAYQLQDQGLDTVEANERLGFPADLRQYGTAAAMLRDLGVRQVRLLTNNPRKLAGLAGAGIEIVERAPLMVEPGSDNARYLAAKRERLGHLLGNQGAAD